MYVLHINCVYPYGSTGKITASIHHTVCASGERSFVIYGRGRKSDAPLTKKVGCELLAKYNNVRSRVCGDPYGGCFLSTSQLLQFLQMQRPDVVHLQCMNGFFANIPRVILFLKEHHIPTVLTLHAEFMYTGNCAHAGSCERWKAGCGHCPRLREATGSLLLDRTASEFRRMYDAFHGFSELTVVGVSEWICQRASVSPILREHRICKINNGIDLCVFSDRYDRGRVRENLKTGQRKLVLLVTPSFDPAKGSDLFFALVDAMHALPFQFAVAGADAPAGYCGDVVFLGNVKDQTELAAYYGAADVLVCCSRYETYPTVCLEAAACGTPVVGFDVGGEAEAVHNGIGDVVALGDIPAMKQKVLEYSARPKAYWKQVLSGKRDQLSDTRMSQAYIALYEQLLEKQHETEKNV